MGKVPKGGIGGAGVIIGAVAEVVPAVINVINDRLPKDKTTVPDDSVPMPEICSKKFPLKLSEATTLLESRGLKVLPIEVRLRDAGVKYKDYFDSQVIAANCKAGAKLKIGDTVVVQYVTQEVIDEGRRIFEETERQKAALKQERVIKRAEQMDRAKVAVADTAGKMRDGLGKMIRRDKKKELGKENSHEQE